MNDTGLSSGARPGRDTALVNAAARRLGVVRVLVVDDSAVIRRIVTDVLDADPEIEVVGTASDGRIALHRFAQLQPDLITLDVEMPEMDGLATLSALRRLDRRVPVVMFSSRTERAATTTIEALARGASDYVTKPSGHSNLAAAMASVRTELLPKVKALCPPPTRSGGAPGGRAAPSRLAAAPRPTGPAVSARPVPARGIEPGLPSHLSAGAVAAPGPRTRSRGVELVVIGVSTGGPSALGQLLPRLRHLPVPVAIVQHMPPMFTKLLAEQLSSTIGIDVREGATGMPLEPSTVYIAPGDHHMVVRRNGAIASLELNQAAPENSCRPAVDVLFRSAATLYGDRVLAVVLTGMGNDGERGCVALHDAGAHVIVQDQATSVVWGMPGAVVRAGLADQVLALGEIGSAIVTRVTRRSR